MTALTREAREQADSLPLVEHDHPNLASALVAALAELTVIEKGSTVSMKTKAGATIKYDFADLPSIVKVTRPVLARHGLVALTPVHDHGTGLACTVKLIHRSGETLDLGPFPFPHGHDAQATGSMVTYHRRYALIAALGMAAGDDDDGAAAKPREPERTVSPKALAKQAVLDLCDGDKDKAAEAWAGIDGDNVRWGSDPIRAATELWESWINEPKDEAS